MFRLNCSGRKTESETVVINRVLQGGVDSIINPLVHASIKECDRCDILFDKVNKYEAHCKLGQTRQKY